MASFWCEGIAPKSTATASGFLVLTTFTALRLLSSLSSAPRAEVATPLDHRLAAYIPFQPALAAGFIPCASHAPGMSTGWCLSFVAGSCARSAALWAGSRSVRSSQSQRSPWSKYAPHFGHVMYGLLMVHLLSRRSGRQFPGELLHEQPPVFLAGSPLLCVFV